MRKTYIATTQEAKALHDGTQTAIIAKMYKQPDGEPATALEWAYGLADACGRRVSQKEIEDKEKQIQTGGIIFPFRSNKTGRLFSPVAIYAIGREVVVRETWAETCDEYGVPIIAFKDGGAHYIGPENEYLAECKAAWSIDNYPSCGKWNSPATMPVSAARTRFIPVSCEAVRVRAVSELYFTELGIIKPDYSNDTIKSIRVNKILERENHYDEYKSYIIHKLGQTAWDNNHYIFYYKIEKI